MSNFVLTRLDGRGWQGPADGKTEIKIKATSGDSRVVTEGAVCSSANPPDLPLSDGVAALTLKKGAQVLTVTIQRMTPPLADWAAAEVDSDGNTQELANVFADEDPADPFSVNVNLQGV